MRASSDPIFDVTARLSYSQSCFFIFISFLIRFLSCLVVSLDVKVGEINCDPPLGWRDDLPDAVLVAENDDDDYVVCVALNIYSSISWGHINAIIREIFALSPQWQ